MRAKRMRGMQKMRVAIGLAAALGICQAVQAAPIAALFASMDATPLFDSTTDTWNVPAAPLLNGIALEDGGFNFFEIAATNYGSPAGAVVWTGNPLIVDTSIGGDASASFGPTALGGTYELHGKLFNFGIEVFDGLLIKGTLSGFNVSEPTTNYLDMVGGATLYPTAGVLVDGTFAEMTTPYHFNFSGAEVMQGGGNLTDFQSDVDMVDVVLFDLVAVPEPASLSLLLAGIALVARRRQG